MYQLYDGMVNSPETELTQNIGASDTTIPVKDASKLPTPPNLAVIGRDEKAETILYTGKNGNTLTGVTRGFQGKARTWKAGAPVARRFTEYDWRALKDNFLLYAMQPVANVKGFGAKGDGVTDDSAAIQSALDTGGVIYFPPGTYVACNLKVKPGSHLIFHPNVVMKYPQNVPSYAAMFYIGDINASTLQGPFKLTGPFTIDATGLSAGKQLKGVLVVGARDFEIDGVIGVSLPDGFPVQLAHTYGSTQVGCEDGVVRNVFAFNASWGALAITAARNIAVENIRAEKGTGSGRGAALVIEPWGEPEFAENINVRVIRSVGMNAIHLTAHDRWIQNVTISNFRVYSPSPNTRGVTFDYDPGVGRISDVVLENGYIDGGEYGLYSTNNTIVQNLIVRTVTIKNTSRSGTRVSGGRWYNCTAQNCGESGFASGFHTLGVVDSVIDGLEAYYESCRSIDNNVNGAVNHGGFRIEAHSKLVLKDCWIEDTRTPNKHYYGVFFVGGRLFMDGTTVKNSTAFNIATHGAHWTGSGAPAGGRWNVGDVYYNPSPAAGGYVGYVCVQGGWMGAGAWAANTSYSVNQIRRPTTNNGHYYRVIDGGTSGPTEPVWPTTSGATVKDPDPATLTSWTPSTEKSVGNIVKPSVDNGFYYKCTVAGTTGTTEPSWPTTGGAKVTDGTVEWTAYKIVTWKEAGVFGQFKPFGAIST